MDPPSPASFPSCASPAFRTAMRAFRTALGDEALYTEILRTTSIDQVYDLTDRLQQEQGRTNDLRNLAKLQTFLNRLNAYADAVDTFVQVKPDVMALIWGPVKLLIQWSSTVSKALGSLIDTASEIGMLLPEFGQGMKMFGSNQTIELLLGLFFQDILDFYLVAVKFYSMKRLKFFFQALWPRKKEELEAIANRIGRHATIFRNEVRLEHIQAEYEARERDNQRFRMLRDSTMRLEYETLKTNLNPPSFDAKLDWLRGRFCADTGNWLLEHPSMLKWLNEETHSPERFVWLRGIPGAGKTFLVQCAIDELRSPSRSDNPVIFAFLDHSNSLATSALSIVHSMVFQLASHSAVLQEFVCQESKIAFQSSLKAATDLLVSLIKSVGLVHVIIDGLDEMEEAERRRLLLELMTITESCVEMRLLVASRSAHDLEPCLKPVSTAIQVDLCNTSGIQTYVRSRRAEWAQVRGFSQPEKTELARLVDPIAEKSKGMFMYARLILKSLDYLDTIEEIRTELKVLPIDLNEAYERIFSRINKQLPDQYTREKARKIIAWVGCSPTPLTIQELEQALSISVGDFTQQMKQYSTLNLLRLCGPVIEIVHEKVHFVHFTAKEFFFCDNINGYLDKGQYTLRLAAACITYLCQSHHHHGIDRAAISSFLLNGAYRLHHFAVEYWLPLVELCIISPAVSKTSEEWIQLIDILRTFAELRQNPVYKPADLDGIGSEHLQCIKGMDADVYQLVAREGAFRKDSRSRSLHLDEVNWSGSDPLTLRIISTEINAVITEIVALPKVCTESGAPDNGERIGRVRRNYGPRIFKCHYFYCRWFRDGFEDRAQQQAHIKIHAKDVKCPIETCDYAEIGFLSCKMRDEHFERHHAPPVSTSTSENSSRDTATDSERLSFWFALIRENEPERLKISLTDLEPEIGFDHARLVLTEASSRGTYEIMDAVGNHLLVEIRRQLKDARSGGRRIKPGKKEVYEPDCSMDSVVTNYVLLPAIDAGNIDTAQWVRDSHQKFSQEWKEGEWGGRWVHFLYPFKHCLRSSMYLSFYQCLSPLFKLVNGNEHSLCGLVRATSQCPEREGLLITHWRSVKPEQIDLDLALKSVAQTTCSLNLASELIKLGAHVNAKKNNGFTALQHATRRNTPEAALLIKFLLYEGADPESKLIVGSREKRAADEVGARQIWKFLNGQTWEELVEEAQEARRKIKDPSVVEIVSDSRIESTLEIESESEAALQP